MTEVAVKETRQTVEQGFARTEAAIQETNINVQDARNELSENFLSLALSTKRAGSGLQDMKEETRGGFSRVLSDVGKTEDAVHTTREELSHKLDIVSDNLYKSDAAALVSLRKGSENGRIAYVIISTEPSVKAPQRR